MIGSARPLIAWASLLLTAVCLLVVVVTMRANGILVLATLFAAVFAWAIGAFTRSFWVADERTSSRLDDVDREIAFVESVHAELRVLDQAASPMLAERIPVASAPVMLTELVEARTARGGIIVGAVAAVIAVGTLMVGLVLL